MIVTDGLQAGRRRRMFSGRERGLATQDALGSRPLTLGKRPRTSRVAQL